MMVGQCLTIYARENEERDTPASYLKKNLRQSGLDYERVTRSFFAISIEQEGTIYYSRCNFSRSARRAIHCFDLVYPQAEKRAWDPVVTRKSLSQDRSNDESFRTRLGYWNVKSTPF
jgi:hypothetical protein